jgi:spermidine synthase
VQVLFAITLFVSAVLLFWVQPMFSKRVLPFLGGVPAVWNTCLVFYQITLLLGYLYVHLTATRLRVRTQILLHVLLIWSIVFLFAFSFGRVPPVQHNPILWLLWTFLSSIGLPFFVLSATAPMLQWWLGRSRQAHVQNPYVLYAISNGGSLLALLCYPVLIEPYLRLSTQHQLWVLGYKVMAVLLSVCGGLMWYGSPQGIVQKTPVVNPGDTITRQQRLHWMICACIPASLLMAVTQYITTDIAAVPLFWVIPLCVYLGTFVLVFAHKPLVRHQWMLRAQTYLVLPLLVFYLGALRTTPWIDFPLHLAAFFVFAMVCHGELANRKPSPQHLTEFYVWMSVGGCFGGLFTALIAPLIFNTMFEYPLMIVLACVMRPGRQAKLPRTQMRWLLIGLLLALLLFPIGLATQDRETVLRLGIVSLILFTAFGGALGFQVLHTPQRVILGLGSFLLAGMLVINTHQQVLVRKRNFFGTLKVVESPQEQLRLFYHGTTLHGAQSLALVHRDEPLTYFHREGPVGQLFHALERQSPRSMAIFGLGVGTLTAYARPGDTITFYEIDPDVEHIAREAKWFSYLHDFPGQVRVVLGDARISLMQAQDHTYNLIIQDAFSSDTIPVHLLTREAFQLYKTKLTTDGLLVFNITNRYLNLEPVLANLIQDSKMVGLIQRDVNVGSEQHDARRYPSVWVVAAQWEKDLAIFKDATRWKPLQRRAGVKLWTDDYSNILSVLR